MHMTYILLPVLVRDNLSSGIVPYLQMEAIIRILSGNQHIQMPFLYRLFFNYLRIRAKRKRFTINISPATTPGSLFVSKP